MSHVEQTTMFSVPLFKVKMEQWNILKELIVSIIGDSSYFVDYGNHQTDYSYDHQGEHSKPYNSYSVPIWNLIRPQLSKVFEDLGLPVSSDFIPSMWSQKYHKGSHHSIHHHGPKGYSCVLYVKFNPEVHQGTRFLAPFNNFVNGDILWYIPEVEEGDLIIFPSSILHESPSQPVDEERMILSFNLN
jgi:hypothetical protein